MGVDLRCVPTYSLCRPSRPRCSGTFETRSCTKALSTTQARLYGHAVERASVSLLRQYAGEERVLDEATFVQEWNIPRRSKRADAAVMTADHDSL